MAEEPLSDEAVTELVRSIQAGTDAVTVPPELVDEPVEQAPKPLPQSLYAQILVMSVSQKIKLALRGNQDARSILVRDTNKLIRRFVLLNPRVTDAEIIALARNKNADEELLRIITERREWMRNYQVRLGLATNPKTAMPVAIRQVSTLDERDLRQIAKSKNVPQAVAAQARRLLFTKHTAK